MNKIERIIATVLAWTVILTLSFFMLGAFFWSFRFLIRQFFGIEI